MAASSPVLGRDYSASLSPTPLSAAHELQRGGDAVGAAPPRGCRSPGRSARCCSRRPNGSGGWASKHYSLLLLRTRRRRVFA